ncbi:nucleotidyltransferase family protein, partial [Devosia sp.]|uniref:nucleotidyltransferase family protein n=1 Tax=Devosia sp. TaxID=1871048 RepID=UPI002EF07646
MRTWAPDPAARFPAYAWAWPQGGLHALLSAAILADLEEAAGAFRRWRADHDLIADVGFAEQRLLVAISARLPPALLSGSERALLSGLERMLWSHSTVALRAAAPALRLLGEAGIELMVFKGAARAAVDMRALRGRYASEIDLLVRRNDFARALDLLAAAGWQGGGGRAQLNGVTGINLKDGGKGEIDLHKYPYHQPVASDGDGAGLWARSREHVFLGQRVRVPSPTDRLVLAIAHGGIDAHKHSDWLVDAALLARTGEVDWPLFELLCRERGIVAHAAIALGYLHHRLAVPVPAPVMTQLEAGGRQSTLRLWAALLQARPKR